MEKRDINGEKGVQFTNIAKQIEVKFLGQNYGVWSSKGYTCHLFSYCMIEMIEDWNCYY